jgi:hypothetical protein
MPMLDEEEYTDALRLYGEGMHVKGAPREQRMRPLLDRYEQMTGFKETNPNAVMHHRLLMYGPPCKRCGKPLRTPKAKLCGACMFPVDEKIVE